MEKKQHFLLIFSITLKSETLDLWKVNTECNSILSFLFPQPGGEINTIELHKIRYLLLWFHPLSRNSASMTYLYSLSMIINLFIGLSQVWSLWHKTFFALFAKFVFALCLNCACFLLAACLLSTCFVFARCALLVRCVARVVCWLFVPPRRSSVALGFLYCWFGWFGWPAGWLRLVCLLGE